MDATAATDAVPAAAHAGMDATSTTNAIPAAVHAGMDATSATNALPATIDAGLDAKSAPVDARMVKPTSEIKTRGINDSDARFQYARSNIGRNAGTCRRRIRSSGVSRDELGRFYGGIWIQWILDDRLHDVTRQRCG